MSEVTFITESVEVPFETIRNKWGVARNASGLAMMQKMFKAYARKEVIEMACKKCAKKPAAKKPAAKKAVAKKPACKGKCKCKK